MCGPASCEMGALAHAERITVALSKGSQIHPQYAREYQSGFAMSWSRSPSTNGGVAACLGIRFAGCVTLSQVRSLR